MLTNDHWTLDLESLGMKAAGDRLTRLILECQPPYAICIQGKWGSGKTSIMRYAMASLGGEPLAVQMKTSKQPRAELPPDLERQWEDLARKSESLKKKYLLAQIPQELRRESTDDIRIVPIWFNPWQHQTAELPLIGLLKEVREQFSALAKASRWAKKITSVAAEASVNIISGIIDSASVLQGGSAVGLGSATSRIREIGEAYERNSFEITGNAQRLNLMFEQAVEHLLGQQRPALPRTPTLRRLTIFIDDLDRCSQEHTVKLLEAIKLYLQTQYCVFVVGIDLAAAHRAVQRHLVHNRQEEAHEYLEKLFQATLPVPVPAQPEQMIRDLLIQWHLDEKEVGESPDSVAGILTQLIEPNPRKLKNFIAGLALGWDICATKDRSRIEFRPYLLVAYLRTYHPEVYRLLAYDPSLAADLQIALTEEAWQLAPTAPAVRRFFHRTFRHSFAQTAATTSTEDSDRFVDELLPRLDRYGGDRAFLNLWKQVFSDSTGDQIAGRIAPVLRLASATPTPEVPAR